MSKKNDFPEEEMEVYLTVAKQMGLGSEDFKPKKLKKDISCPFCDVQIVFRIMNAVENCFIKKAKYQIRCEECKQDFETDWRQFLQEIEK